VASPRVAVVGAGAVGASTAFYLSRRGARVVLFDARGVAAGASGRSAGLVRVHHPFLADAALAIESYARLSRFEAEVGGPCGLVRTGFVRIVERRLEPVLRENVRLLQGMGAVCEVRDAARFSAVDPRLDLTDVHAVAYEPESGYADPYLTTTTYAEASGAELHVHCPVTGLEVATGTLTLNTADGEAGGFDAVVLALGADVNQLLISSGLDPVYAYRRDHAVVFVRWPREAAPHVAAIDGPNDVYLRSEGADLTLVGPSVVRNEDGLGALSGALTERAVAAIARRIPDLGEGTVQSGYVSWDTHTPDQHAIIDQLLPGVFCATGFSGSGFKLSPAVGAHLADWVVDRGPVPPPLAPYRADRFRRHAWIREPNGYGDRYFEREASAAPRRTAGRM
jgi:sarcosine oxidase subunit beta